MDRVLARLRGTEKDSKSDGSFMFAISLIVASFTILYKTYIYVCNNLIIGPTYFIIIISFIIILVIFASMSLFILMKAISLEVKSPKSKKKLEIYATGYYLIGFLLGTFYLLLLFISCSLKVVFDIVISLLNIPNISYKLLLAYIIISMILFVIITIIFSKSSNQVIEPLSAIIKEIHSYKAVLVLTLIFFVPLFYMPNNYVTIEVDDIYSDKSEQIPIDITVTGVQYDYVTVNLSKADVKDNLKLIDSINMKTNSDPNKVISSEYLIGSNLELGRYKFYINSTNLSEGYYELSVTTKKEFFIIVPMETKTDSFYLV